MSKPYSDSQLDILELQLANHNTQRRCCLAFYLLTKLISHTCAFAYRAVRWTRCDPAGGVRELAGEFWCAAAQHWISRHQRRRPARETGRCHVRVSFQRYSGLCYRSVQDGKHTSSLKQTPLHDCVSAGITAVKQGKMKAFTQSVYDKHKNAYVKDMECVQSQMLYGREYCLMSLMSSCTHT